MPDLAKLERDLGALEQDHSLYDDDNLAARFLALKTLDFLEEAFQIRADHQPVAARLQRVRALQTDLKRRNQALFQTLRIAIRTGIVMPRQLRTLFESNCRYRPGDMACQHWGAEAADALAAGLFRSDCPPQQWDGGDAVFDAPLFERGADEMIHYESTPVSALLELVDRVPLTRADRFVDIGSGLGQVVLLVHLLTRRGGDRAGGYAGVCGAGAPRRGNAGNRRGDLQTGGRPHRRPVRRYGLLSFFPLSRADAANGARPAASRGNGAPIDDLLLWPLY